MNIIEFARSIIDGGSLDDKLSSFEGNIDFPSQELTKIPDYPSRNKKISFSDQITKFPKKGSLKVDVNKAKALNFFANHELLAIEMMAAAILKYPHNNDELKKFKIGMLKNLQDEQKHLRLYINRMNDLGYEFGDFALNDFFWKQMAVLDSPAHFLSVMALTFEAANLDFAKYYSQLFLEFDDIRTSKILDQVLVDEISHVGFGVHFMNLWRKDYSLWEYYLKYLPWPMTPNRAKGIQFDENLRVKAKMPPSFIDSIKNYHDSFPVTQRKEWKQ